MVSTFTPNVQLEEPARGDDVGTWDTPVNGNTTNLDLLIGGIATIPLNNSNVVLSAAQYRCRTIIFNSTLTGSVTITFPTSFTKDYNVYNSCTGAFTITLATTAVGQVICAPPGESVQSFNDGANLRYMNLGRVGTYETFAGNATPAWITGCTIPPYLPCSGAAFSSATYPALATLLGTTTLPDRRGTVGADLDQGATRLTNIGALFQVGGDQNTQAHNHGGATGTESASHTHSINGGANFVVGNAATTVVAGGADPVPQGPTTISGVTTSESATHTHSIPTYGTGGGQNLQPTTIVGITHIRAA